MDAKRIYKQASGVDIDSAHTQYDEERAIGYDGEFMLFKHLLRNDDFEHSKLLTNLVIPSGNGNSTTEIDMVLIAKCGIIVFEVKNYKGTIYGNGNDKYWTQYFRTAENNKFNNPIKQNEYHVQALKRLCPQKIYSIVFFSNYACDITRVKTFNNEYAVADTNSIDYVLNKISQSPQALAEDEINTVFEHLKKYTNATFPTTLYSSSEINSFDAFVDHSKKYIYDQIKEKEKTCKKDFRGKVATCISISALIVAITTILCFSFIFKAHERATDATASRDEALAQYNEMYEKFSVVSEDDIELSQSLLSISNVSISVHDYLNGSSLSFTIKNNSKTAHIVAKSNQAKVLVTLKDGSVQEYSLKNIYSIYPGKQSSYTLSLSCQTSEIQYIKMETLYISSNGQRTHPFSVNIYGKYPE